jgi:hypothetical protein
MPEYLSPGVYVEEIDSGPKPIEGVSTSTAAFIGFTEKVPYKKKKVNGNYIDQPQLNKPTLVTSWTQYVENFGGFAEGAYLPYSVYGFFQNGGTRAYIVSIQEMPKAQKALPGTNVTIRSKQAGINGTRVRFKIEPDVPQEAPALPDAEDAKGKKDAKAAPPKASEPSSFSVTLQHLEEDGTWKEVEQLVNVTPTVVEVKDDEGKMHKKVRMAYKYNRPSEWIHIDVAGDSLSVSKLGQSATDWQYMEFTKAKQLPVAETGNLVGDTSARTGMGGLSAVDDVSILCMPELMTPAPGQDGPDPLMVKAVQDSMVAHCELMGDRVCLLDPLPGLNPQEMKQWRLDGMPDSSYATTYYPWIEIMDPVQNRPILIPPSGHVAGIWARTDSTRGVHKAPANEPLRNITGLEMMITKGEQDILNPIGVNCLRSFPGRGTRVWGARTLSSNPSWRYLNVRRLFNYVEKSIEESTQWVVFEPNDPDLWARVSRDVTAFLKTVWSSGALFGLTPDEAFYVKCDAELNPPESRDLGRLVIEIAMSPVKPAEFVIFRIMQKNEY